MIGIGSARAVHATNLGLRPNENASARVVHATNLGLRPDENASGNAPGNLGLTVPRAENRRRSFSSASRLRVILLSWKIEHSPRPLRRVSPKPPTIGTLSGAVVGAVSDPIDRKSLVVEAQDGSAKA